MFTELYREEEWGEIDRGGQKDKRGKRKGERQFQPITSSLSVLHHLQHTDFTELGRDEKGEGRDRATWWRKSRVQRRRAWSSQ